MMSATITEPTSYGLACWNIPAPFMDQAHQHNDIELNYSEVPLAYIIGGDRLTLPAQRIVMFWAARPHQLIRQSDTDPTPSMTWATVPLERAMSWSLPDDGVQSLLGGGVIISSPAVAQLYRHQHLSQWQDDLTSSSVRRHDVAALEVQAAILRMLDDSTTGPSGLTDSLSPALTRVADMTQFISRECHRPLRVETIAEVAHVHPHHAMAIFKEAIGCTITAYLTQTRVAQAQRLLLTTDLSVSEIGHRAGFGSQSRFYAAFVSHTGTPPFAFRRRHHEAARRS